MGELRVRKKPVGILRRIAEKAGRMRLTRSPSASTLVDLESLDQRINSKLDMWHALRSSIGDRVDDFEFDELIGRAEGQAEALRARRLAVAADALSRATPQPRRAGKAAVAR
jgi:hypothetical protein